MSTPSTDLAKHSLEAFGTIIEITVDSSFDSVFDECVKEIQRVESTYSRFLPSSDLSRMNMKLGEWQEVDTEMFSLLQLGLTFHEMTSGYFDITMKSSLEKLGYGQSSGVYETDGPVEFEEPNKVLLYKQVEFGGFGKGWLLDRLADILRKHTDHFRINAGGDQYAECGDGRTPWRVLLEHPSDPKQAIGELTLNGEAIACSSANRRKWDGGHHLLDPKSQTPKMGVHASWVIAKTGAGADALATALFVAGDDSFAKDLPIRYLLITSEIKEKSFKKYLYS